MYINIGKDLQNRLQDIINKVTEKQNVILDVTFYPKDCRVIFRNNDERKTYKAVIYYDKLNTDINLKDNVFIKRHYDRRYESLH